MDRRRLMSRLAPFALIACAPLAMAQTTPTPPEKFGAFLNNQNPATLPFSPGDTIPVIQNGITNKYPASGLKLLSPANAFQTNVGASPGGTTDTVGKMAGLAGTGEPGLSGTLIFTISGNISTDTNSAGATVQASYGTGAAPANGTLISGTQCGSRPTFIGEAPSFATTQIFTVNCAATGLTIGRAYWLDVTLATITSGTASVSNVSISAVGS